MPHPTIGWTALGLLVNTMGGWSTYMYMAVDTALENKSMPYTTIIISQSENSDNSWILIKLR